MNTIKFIVTAGVEEHVFRKDSFRQITTTYTSGDTGLVEVYSAPEGDIVDLDRIRLTVNKDFISIITTSIQKLLSEPKNSEVKHSQTKGIYQQVTSMGYTAG